METQNRGKQHLAQTEDPLDAAVEDALQSLPVFAPPPDLYGNVMTKITARQAETARPAFRVSWMDLALSIFFAGMVGLALLLTDWLPIELRMDLAHELRLFELMQLDWVLWAGLGISAAACLAAAAVFAGLQIGRARR